MLTSTIIAPGVVRVEALTPTLPPATHTNSYALGQRQLLLVEPATPYEEVQRQWLAWARGLISQGREALAILLTHHHPDHVGGAEMLAGELGLPTWAHRETQSRVSVPISRLLEDGETITLAGPTDQAWQCLHTPGHAPGHLCFYDSESGIAVVGDMVASVGTIVVDPYDGDMVAYLDQLRRLLALDLKIALPAHGEPVTDPNALFRHYIAHRLGREAKVLNALQSLTPTSASEPVDLDQLVEVAYATTPKMLWPLAKLSLEAHLIKLLADSQAQRHDGGRWRACYGAA